MTRRRTWTATISAFACAVAVSALASGCSGKAAATQATTIDVWVHTGTPAELATIRAQIAGFNAKRNGTTAQLTVIPEGDYQDVLQAAAAGGRLPDVLEVDGPMLSSLDYQSALADLTDLLPAQTVQAMLPSLRAQGTVGDRLVGAGTFESGLGLYGNRKLLDAAGVTYPTGVDESWTAEQLTGAITALARRDKDRKVLDVKRNYGTGAWLTYGVAPLVWSAGGDLVDRRTGRASGVLDGAASVRALTQLQQWTPFVEANKDDKAFQSGRVALSWVGHWVYPDYAAALGDDLVVLPLPHLGHGTKTGQGSFAWSISKDASRSAAGAFVSYLLSAPEVTRISQANGAVPGRGDVLTASRLYGPGGPLERFGRQLARTCGSGPITAECIAVSRPVTPAFPTINASFSSAVTAVMAGADPQKALTEAAAAIDADLEANGRYAERP